MEKVYNRVAKITSSIVASLHPGCRSEEIRASGCTGIWRWGGWDGSGLHFGSGPRFAGPCSNAQLFLLSASRFSCSSLSSTSHSNFHQLCAAATTDDMCRSLLDSILAKLDAQYPLLRAGVLVCWFLDVGACSHTLQAVHPTDAA